MTDKKDYQTLLAEAEAFLSNETSAALSDRITLRNAVCAYLAAEQARGTPIETVRATVERILERAEERIGSGAPGSDGHRELAQKLIDWCAGLVTIPRLRIV